MHTSFSFCPVTNLKFTYVSHPKSNTIEEKCIPLQNPFIGFVHNILGMYQRQCDWSKEGEGVQKWVKNQGSEDL